MKSLRLFPCLLLVLLILLKGFASNSKGRTEKENLFDHEIDSEQIKDADEMLMQSTNNTKQGLSKLFDKIDINKDFYVTKDELIKWILQYNEQLLIKETNFEFKEMDRNKDDFISWDEFYKKHYGNLSIEINNFDNEMTEYLINDKFRFKIADSNKDERLSFIELKAFLRPHNHVEMLDFEVYRALIEYDKNNDKTIDREEFFKTQYGNQRLSIQHKTYVNKIFDNFDTNHNGQLSEEEIKKWLKPDITQFAQTESEYLLNVSDANNDSKLSKEEIVKNFGHWVSSKATNFGADLKDEL